MISSDPLNAILIRVFLKDGLIHIDPLNADIPWDYQGVVRWTVDDPIAEFDPELGIRFPNLTPFSPRLHSPKVFEMVVDNHNRLLAPMSFIYDVKLTDDGVGLDKDPTVRNDSPPPVPGPFPDFRRRVPRRRAK